MTYYCSHCIVNWWPYHCQDGACPLCGGGTSRRQEPASDDVDTLFKGACAERAQRERRAAFDLYYRTQHVPDASDVDDELEAIGRLEPRDHPEYREAA